MSKASAPAPPNPTLVGQAQTGTNIGTAVAQQSLNNTNQVNPFSTTSFSQSGGYTDPTTGQWVPSYTENTSLNPTLNNVLSTTENAANNNIGAVTNPLNPNQTANNGIIAGGPQALDQPVAQAAYNASTQFLTPTFQQQQQDLQDQLSRQGIPLGSQGYGNAENQLQNTQNAALTGAANNATVTGANQANNMFGLALQGQNQNLGQQQTLQSNPLALLQQLGGSSTTGVA